jgi:micrococcal nuclease
VSPHVATVGVLTAAAACGTTEPRCGATAGVVDRVIDGDTVVLTTGEKIRYLLVDAPEITNGHDDCYGANAAQVNRDLVLGKAVELGDEAGCADAYGRRLAYVRVDGVDVNRRLVERGAACVLHLPPDGDDRVDEFLALQAEARAARRGLWGACPNHPCDRSRTSR